GNVGPRAPSCREVEHRVVDMARPEAAAERADERARARGRRPHGGDLAPDRVPGQHRAPQRRPGQRDRGARTEADGHAVREPGRGVLLVYDHRDPAQPRREHARDRRVPADADDDAGPALPEDAPRAGERARRTQGGDEVVAQRTRPQAPLQPAAREEVDRVAGGGHDARLEPAGRTDEVDRVARMAAPDELVRDREGRVDVPAGPAPGHEREGAPLAHVPAHLTLARSGRDCLAMLARMPAPTIVNTSDDPPNDTNGSGIPETGSRPTTPPMLMAAWAVTHTVMPAARSMPKRSGARAATRTPRTANATNSERTSSEPIRPSSSPLTAKMKSVCAFGRKCHLARPAPRPTPVSPPVPMAMSDCTIWYPVLPASAVGCRKVSTRARRYGAASASTVASA